MLAQRVAQQSLRRALAGSQLQHNALRFAAPAAIALGNNNVIKVQRRLAAATTIPKETQQDSILAQQRLNRPVAPHLAIYKPQVTWYLSALNRITGLIVSGAFYAFGGLYLIAPYVGLHMESAVIAASFGAWPWVAKFAVKLGLALPFTFHSFNGIRHLVWDTASMITNKKVQQSGWFVVGLSVVSAVALAVM